MDFYCRSQRCCDTAVLVFRQLDGLCYSLCGDVRAFYNMMHLHQFVTPRMLLATFSGDLHFVARNLLSLLGENAYDINSRAGAECYQEKFNRTRCSRAIVICVKCDGVA